MWSEEWWAKTALICLPDELYKCGSLEPTDSEQQSSRFWFLCLLWEQHSQLESKVLPNILCWVLLPRMFWVCFVTLSGFHTVWCPSWHCCRPVSCLLLALGWTTLSSISAVEDCQSFTLLSSVSGCFKVTACFLNEVLFHLTGSGVFAACGTYSAVFLPLSHLVISLWYLCILALGFIVVCVLCLSLLCCKILQEISSYTSFSLKCLTSRCFFKFQQLSYCMGLPLSLTLGITL